MSHACHRFWKCQGTPRFAHFWQGAQSLAPAMRNDIWTSKSVRNPGALTFWLRNVLRVTTACTFSTSQLPNVLSKSAPRMVCFVHFDLEMCFAPQRRTLFRRLNFQKCSDFGVFCAFWLGNVLRVTTACNFRHLNFQKWSGTVSFLHFWLWKCASRHNRVQLFISHLAKWIRTCRFSEPTFRPSGATNHGKNTVFHDFATFSRTCIFCLLTWLFLFSDLIFFSSLLWLFPPLLFHLSILSEVWLLNFLRWINSTFALDKDKPGESMGLINTFTEARLRSRCLLFLLLPEYEWWTSLLQPDIRKLSQSSKLLIVRLVCLGDGISWLSFQWPFQLPACISNPPLSLMASSTTFPRVSWSVGYSRSQRVRWVRCKEFHHNMTQGTWTYYSGQQDAQTLDTSKVI